MPTDPRVEQPKRRMSHEPGKTPGSAEGEEPLRTPRPDVGRTPGSAEGEDESQGAPVSAPPRR
jgi:hypothetical protein